MASEEDEDYSLIANMADYIKEGWVIDTSTLSSDPTFKAKVELWKEPESQMNLLQLAVIYNNVPMVSMLHHKYSFQYKTMKHKEKKHKLCIKTTIPPLVILIISNVPFASVAWRGISQRHRKRSAHFKFERGVKVVDTFDVDVNSPLHLACYLGHLEAIKIFLDDDTITHLGLRQKHSDLVLQQKSVLNLEKIATLHSEIVTSDLEQSAVQNGPVKFQTPFDICLENGHLECCHFISRLIFKHTIFLYDWKQERPPADSNQLHIACHMSHPSYLKALLQDESYADLIDVPDSLGKPPLWIALTSKLCVNILLERGADATVIVDQATLLQWLFYSTQAFINGSSAINLLNTASELILHGVDICARPWDETNNKYILSALEYFLQLVATGDREIEIDLADIVVDFVENLVKNGARTVFPMEEEFSNIYVDSTAGHAFLHWNINFPKNVFISNNSVLVCSIIETLFEEGALDANVIPVNDHYNLLLHLLIDWMPALNIELQRFLLHIFYLNGANFNRIHPRNRLLPFGDLPFETIGWYELPLVIAFYKHYDTTVLLDIMNFMEVNAVNECWSRLELYRTSVNEESLISLKMHYEVRSLYHLAKNIIICCLGTQGSYKIHSLALPDIVKYSLARADFC